MSEKQNKSRVFVIVLIVMVVAIIAIGLFFTWLIVKEGEKNKTASFIERSEAYIVQQASPWELTEEHIDFNKLS